MFVSLNFVSLLLLSESTLAFISSNSNAYQSVSSRRTATTTATKVNDNDESGESSSSGSRRNFLKYTSIGASAIATAGGNNVLLPAMANADASVVGNTLSLASESTASAAGAGVGAIKLPPMGLGAWAWGDSVFWGYNKKQDGDLKTVFNYALSKNLAFFDTAELYGLGRSETLLGDFRAASGEDGEKVQIATKFAALPFRTKSKDVVNACRASLKRLNPDNTNTPIDLYQIHFPNAWSNEDYWDGLAQCYEEGLVKSVGVSNYGVDALRAVHSKLAQRGIPLATNQIQLSLLYKYPIENGLLDACNDLGVQVLSYSPLALGFLTGKYDKDTRPEGPRANIAKTLFDGDAGSSFADLVQVMKDVSGNHGGAPLSQVALNWTRSKGTVPIPGARSLKQATQNIGALDWSLSEEEVRLLDLVSSKVPAYITPDKSPFPKEDINTKLKMFDS